MDDTRPLGEVDIRLHVEGGVEEHGRLDEELLLVDAKGERKRRVGLQGRLSLPAIVELDVHLAGVVLHDQGLLNRVIRERAALDRDMVRVEELHDLRNDQVLQRVPWVWLRERSCDLGDSDAEARRLKLKLKLLPVLRRHHGRNRITLGPPSSETALHN